MESRIAPISRQRGITWRPRRAHSLLALAVCTVLWTMPRPVDAAGYPLANVVEQFKRELVAAQKYGTRFCPLDIESAVFVFRVGETSVAQVSGGASFEITGIRVGASLRKQETRSTGNTITLTLRPPSGAREWAISREESMPLADLIVETKKAIEAAARGEPALAVETVQIAYQFDLDIKQGGGVEFVAVEAGAEGNESRFHRITLTLEPTDAARCG